MVIVTKNPNVNSFLRIVEKNLQSENFILKKHYSNLDKDFKYQGYFDEHQKEIGILMSSRVWLEILVHEYSHFLQWKFDNPTYLAYNSMKIDPVSIIENYIKKKSSHTETVKKAFQIVRKNEANCESIAIKLIKKYNLPLDLVNYKQSSNLHLVFYHCVEATKIWNVKNFYSARMKSIVPKTFQKIYADRVPQNIMTTALNVFEKYQENHERR